MRDNDSSILQGHQYFQPLDIERVLKQLKKITDSSGEKLEVPVAKGIPIDKHTKITALSFTGMDPMSASGSPERMR